MRVIEGIASLLPSFVLPVTMLLRIAYWKYAGGNCRSALRTVDRALARLRVDNAGYTPAGEAWLLKGKILVSLGSNEDAAVASMHAYECGTYDKDSLCLLASTLLEKEDSSPLAQNVYLDYLTCSSDTDDHERLDQNLECLKRISEPDLRDEDKHETFRLWNELIISRKDDLAWAHEYVARIALARCEWTRAIPSLERAYQLQPAAYHICRLLAYALAKDGQFVEAKKYLDLLVEMQPRRGTLLLRAHVSRCLGSPLSAVEDYRRAKHLHPIDGEDALGYAEALLNSGKPADAARLLDTLSCKKDARWVLLNAVACQMNGELFKALQEFCQIISDANFGKHAASRIVGLVAQNPDILGGIAALRAIPATLRDRSYWITLGNVCLAQGQLRNALKCWQRVDSPEPDLVYMAGHCARYYSANLYLRGQDEQIDRDAPLLLGNPRFPEEVRSVVTASIVRNSIKKLQTGAYSPQQCIERIAQAEVLLRESAQYHHLIWLRGMAEAASNDYRNAFDTLSSLGSEGMACSEVAFQLARCALHGGDPDACSALLRSMDPEDPRVARLRMAHAGSIGNWSRAAAELDGTPLVDNESGIKAAILLLAGKSHELLQIPPSTGDILYYHAFARINMGDHRTAAQMLSGISGEDPVSPAANRLLGWIKLQESRSHFEEGMSQAASQSLLAAFRLWPQDGGPMSRFRDANPKMVRICLRAGDREQLRIYLERQAEVIGPGDPATCHNLGVFHLAEGSRHMATDNIIEGITSLERAIAYLCVPLAHASYLRDWIELRRATYQFEAPERAQAMLEDRMLGLYESVLVRSERALTTKVGERDASRLSSLPLLLRSELRGAKVLAEVGGFKRTKRSRIRICAGPTYVHLADLTRKFAHFYQGLKVERIHIPDFSDGSPASLLLELFEAVSKNDEGVDASKKTELGRLFSALRFAAVLQHESRLEESLERLRNPALHCPVLVSGGNRTVGSLKAACNQSCPTFSACNPAFACKNGAQKFQSFATNFEIELLTEFGRAEVASPRGRMPLGVALWREALKWPLLGNSKKMLPPRFDSLCLGEARYFRIRTNSRWLLNSWRA